MQKRTPQRRVDNRHIIATKSRHIRVPVTEMMGAQIDAAAKKQKISTAQFMREAAIAKIGVAK